MPSIDPRSFLDFAGRKNEPSSLDIQFSHREQDANFARTRARQSVTPETSLPKHHSLNTGQKGEMA